MLGWLTDKFYVSKPNIMFGIDLKKWEYLGYGEISYTNNSMTSWIHYFCYQEDREKRLYVHVGEFAKKMRNHRYILNHAELWKLNELPLNHGPTTHPSKWLIKICLEKGLIWDWDDNVWKNSSMIEEKPKFKLLNFPVTEE